MIIVRQNQCVIGLRHVVVGLLLFSVCSSASAKDLHAYEGKKLAAEDVATLKQYVTNQSLNVIASVDDEKIGKYRWFEHVYVLPGMHRVGFRFFLYEDRQDTYHSRDLKVLEFEARRGHSYTAKAFCDPRLSARGIGYWSTIDTIFDWWVWVEDENTGEVVAGEVMTPEKFALAHERTPDPAELQVSEAGVSYANGRFIDLGNDTIEDTKSGLVWQRDDNISRPGGKHSDGFFPGRYAKYLNSIKFGGRSDWRIPSKKDLLSLELDKYDSYSLPFEFNAKLYQWRGRSGRGGTVNWAKGKIHAGMAAYTNVANRVVAGELRE